MQNKKEERAVNYLNIFAWLLSSQGQSGYQLFPSYHRALALCVSLFLNTGQWSKQNCNGMSCQWGKQTAME